MATTYIGKPISLLSHSDVRYRGILAGVDQVNSTIQLQNVYSVGTEDRRPPSEYIPPAEQPYQFIIFRASEVKDIALDFDTFEPPPRVRSVHDDPAVIGVQGPPPPTYQPSSQYTAQPQQVPATLGTRPPPQSTSPAVPAGGQNGATSEKPQTPEQTNVGRSGRRTGGGQRDSSANSGSVQTAAASLEKVERALGDLRLSNAQAQNQTRSSTSNSNGTRGRRSGGRQGGHQNQTQHVEITVPTTDFDFESANARFDKAALTSAHGKTASPSLSDDEKTNPSDEENDGKKAQTPQSEADKEGDRAYNPKKSFFDSLSSSATSLPPTRGRGGRGMGKSRREEEREKNVATFGEPGGVGLMGPGAYVGGYGGYGRRGGRGGRRGGPRRQPANDA